MAEDKDSGKLASRISSSNQLLLILLAGTLFVSQKPFHDSRPEKHEIIPHSLHPVHARTWQDPFEEVEKYLKENKNGPESLDDTKSLRDSINDKASANGLDKLKVVAVMLPSAPPVEYKETRRRLRYAVLSGFNAALRYMPENSDHINFLITDKSDKGPRKALIPYEWLVYKPTDRKASSPENNERRYERPPVLLLWLNDEDFSVTPHRKLKGLITALAQQKNGPKFMIDQVSILGPFDSDGLQDLVSEVIKDAKRKDAKKDIRHCENPNDDACYAYYSPNATVQECNLLPDESGFKDCAKLENLNKYNLHSYFKEHGLKFLRVTATDLHLAHSLKAELKLRGIEPSEKNRILLVGEWDSLYDWHLSNTFAATLLDGRGNYCRGDVNEAVQKWNKTYDHDKQCIFSANYLRGLDGENPNTSEDKKSSGNRKSPGGGAPEIIERASGDSQYDYVRRLADQIEKLDRKICGSGNWSLYRNAHAIKAIGILGSDVYDKLLISEALHAKFPDALFFTNGMDARFLQPEHNEWARNMVMTSGFGLQLDHSLQNSIPPFRDSAQTAYFLATEMALANQFNGEGDGKPYHNANLWFDDGLRALLRLSSQTDYDEKLFYDGKLFKARIFELGRTQAFDLSPPNSDYVANKTYLHPEPDKHLWDIGHMAVIFIAICAALLFFQTSRQFLGQISGLYFSIGMAAISVICLGLAFLSGKVSGENLGHLENYCLLTSFILMIIYVLFISFVVTTDEDLSIATDKSSLEEEFFNRNTLLSLVSFAVALYIIWRFVEPQGWLDGYEPYALLEGVSMWPSQAIRLIAVVLAGYFIIEAMRFPSKFTSRLEKHFCLRAIQEREGQQSEAEQNHTVLDKWLRWQKPIRVRHYFWASGALFLVEIFALWFFGVPGAPSRGDSVFSLNLILLQGLLVPAALILLVVVSDHLIAAVGFVDDCFPDDVEDYAANWKPITLERYATLFNLHHGDNAHLSEWVGMRFISELTRYIYTIIGYPLVITLLSVLGYFSYFDNWQMPVHVKLSIGLCLIWLLFWDFRLKNAADNARENALKSLHRRVIACQQGDEQTKTRGKQLESLISMIKNNGETVYKSFTQRPIFLNSLLIMIALLADSIDYATLASNFFKG